VSGVNPLRQPVGYMAQRYPSFAIDASPGRKVGDISGTIATTLAPFIALRTTVYVVQLGTNDVAALVPAATFATQVNTVVSAIRAAPFFKLLIWIGPGFTFENWPDGANAFDTVLDGIRDKDTQLAAAMAALPSDCAFVSWRTCRINALNATTNPTHATTGIYTSDGTHPTSAPTSANVTSGDNLLSSFTVPLLTFA
jgi:lysophospholipase L1-like esterase